MNKNVGRLAERGILEKESFQETVIRHTGADLDTYPRRHDGSRRIRETERILSYLDGRGAMRRQALLEDVRTHHDRAILAHLREEGVVERVQGGADARTRMTLTAAGSTVVNRVIEPLFQAIAPEFTWGYATRAEYEQTWATTPPVDESYLEGEYREPLRDYHINPRRYRDDVSTVNRIDRDRNPWR